MKTRDRSGRLLALMSSVLFGTAMGADILFETGDAERAVLVGGILTCAIFALLGFFARIVGGHD